MSKEGNIEGTVCFFKKLFVVSRENVGVCTFYPSFIDSGVELRSSGLAVGTLTLSHLTGLVTVLESNGQICL